MELEPGATWSDSHTQIDWNWNNQARHDSIETYSHCFSPRTGRTVVLEQPGFDSPTQDEEWYWNNQARPDSIYVHPLSGLEFVAQLGARDGTGTWRPTYRATTVVFNVMQQGPALPMTRRPHSRLLQSKACVTRVNRIQILCLRVRVLESHPLPLRASAWVSGQQI